MKARLASLLGTLAISAVCFGLTSGLANASETRQSNFLIACDGTNKVVNLTFTGLGTAATRFVQSAEISIFENNGGLQFVLVGATNPAGLTDLFLTLGKNEITKSNQFTGFYSLTNSGGSITFQVIGACNVGAGQVQGIVVIGFFS